MAVLTTAKAARKEGDFGMFDEFGGVFDGLNIQVFQDKGAKWSFHELRYM